MFEHESVTIGGVDLIAFVALGVVMVSSVALWVLGSRFTRRYVALNRAMPPLTWMFRRSADPDLEDARRLALTFLPFDVIAAIVFVLRG